MIKRPPGYRLQGRSYLFSNMNVTMCFILLAPEEAKKKSTKSSIAFIRNLKKEKIELHYQATPYMTQMMIPGKSLSLVSKLQ